MHTGAQQVKYTWIITHGQGDEEAAPAKRIKETCTSALRAAARRFIISQEDLGQCDLERCTGTSSQEEVVWWVNNITSDPPTHCRWKKSCWDYYCIAEEDVGGC